MTNPPLPSGFHKERDLAIDAGCNCEGTPTGHTKGCPEYMHAISDDEMVMPNTLTLLDIDGTKWNLQIVKGLDFSGLIARPRWWFRLWQRVFFGWKWSAV